MTGKAAEIILQEATPDTWPVLLSTTKVLPWYSISEPVDATATRLPAPRAEMDSPVLPVMRMLDCCIVIFARREYNAASLLM